MNRRRLTTISIVVLCGIALCISLPAGKVSAQNAVAQSGSDQNISNPEDQNQPDAHTKGAIYNPYPPGILPPDLNPEVERVLREIRVVEKRALARWRALTPPTLTGQPPILKGTGTEAVETLGELMQYDHNISPNRNVACASCHMPYVAFSGPIPPVNNQEMGFPDTACITFRLSQAKYRPLFEEVFGKGSFDINFPADTEQICHTPGGAAKLGGSTTPVRLSPADRTRSNQVYDHW